MKQEQNQHKIFIIGFLAIALVIAWFLAKPFLAKIGKNKANESGQALSEEILKAPSLTARDLFTKIKNKEKIYILDLGSLSDFRLGHIEASQNIEAENINSNFLGSLGAQKTSDIIIVGSGSDLQKTAPLVNKIVGSGYVNCKYLQGGISEWQTQGYPLVSLGGAGQGDAKVRKISIDEIKKETDISPESVQFLDARDKKSFSQEHIINAMNIPLSELEARKEAIPGTKKIIVYGQNENEAFEAAVVLFDLNFFNIYQMEGTIDSWKAAGGSTETGG